MAAGSDQSKDRLELTLDVLFEITDAVSGDGNLLQMYAAVHKALARVFPETQFFIALSESPGETFRFPYFAGQGTDPSALPEDLSTPLIREVVRQRQSLVFSGKEIGSPEAAVPGVWMGAPLALSDEVIGVMAVYDPGSHTADCPTALSLLRAASRHVALAIERKASGFRFKGQREILEKILEASPVGIALVQNRIFKWVNTEMVRMFGYGEKSEFQDQSVKMIYKEEEDFELAGRTIYQGLSSSGRVDYDMELIRADNSRFPVHVCLNSTSSDDPMSWTIATFSDISGRRAAEKEGVERERLQGVLEMAGAVCHEINQPLQAIIGNAELLEMDPKSALSRSSVRSIKSQAARLGKITASLANITQYKTMDYPGNTRIMDIWEAGSRER